MAATPSKLLPPVPVPTSRLGTTLQLVPFHCSISVSKFSREVLKVNPTAQMSVAVTTATPFRVLLDVPPLGLETTFHFVPFQRSISVWVSLPEYPTAQMSVAETTATPFKALSDVPTLGLLTTLQLVPFQCSVSVCPTPPVLPSDPTAQMSVAETTATPINWLKE